MARRKGTRREPLPPNKLPSVTGGWVGETLNWSLDDARAFRIRVGLPEVESEEALEGFKRGLDRTADQCAGILSGARSEPTEAEWQGHYRAIAKQALKLRQLLLAKDDPSRLDLAMSEVVDRMAMSAHGVTFRAIKDNDRDSEALDIALDLGRINVAPADLMALLQDMPHQLEVLRLAANAAAIRPMVLGSSGQETALTLVAGLYEEATGRPADQGKDFRRFATEFMRAIGHPLHGDGKSAIQRALEELEQHAIKTA